MTTTKQHAIVNTQLNIVTCPTYPDKFIRDNVVAPSVLLSVVIVMLPLTARMFFQVRECFLCSGMGQWLGRRSLTCGLSLICARSMVGRWQLSE